MTAVVDKQVVETEVPAAPTVDGAVLKPPAAPAAPGRNATLKLLLGYLLAEKAKLAFSVVAVLVAVGCNVTIPYLLGVGIDELANEGASGRFGRIGALMVVLALVSWGCLFLNGLMVAQVAQTAMERLRQDLFEHLQSLSVSFYDRQPIGEIMSRLVNDVNAVNVFFSSGITQFLQSVFLVALIVPVMFLLNVPLTIAVLLVVPLMLAALRVLGRSAGPAYRELQLQLGELNGFMEECINGHRTLQAYGQERRMLDEFVELSEAARKADQRANYFGSLAMPATNVLANVDLAVVAAVGAFLSIQHGLAVGTIATFLGYARQFSSPLIQISNLTNFTLQATAGGARVFEILDEQPSVVDHPDARAFPSADGEVRFEHVDFGYTPQRRILHDNTFHAQPGEMIGLCGPTGAGKSTIINVLTRFYDIERGAIEVDGQSIYDLRQDDLRRRTGIVLQTPYLFATTVRENLRYAKPDATDDEVEGAARSANAHEFVLRLPKGYDTVLAPGGRNLSQGQAQLLTIARAILADPDVLILDEATSSVDTRTERKIQEALNRLMEGRTSFVIAHRLSTIRGAARILVIDRGRIVEQGPHDELVANDGLYRQLYVGQFKQELLEP